jgi:death-on-curing protein
VLYLSLGAVLYLHEQLIKAFGGSLGIRDQGGLKSALARPRSTFGGQPLYPSLLEKAAALLESLCLNHPFVDGNKRVAYAAAGLFLELNGWRLRARPRTRSPSCWRSPAASDPKKRSAFGWSSTPSRTGTTPLGHLGFPALLQAGR